MAKIFHRRNSTRPANTNPKVIDGPSWNDDHDINSSELSSAIGINIAGNPNGTINGVSGDLTRDTTNGKLWVCNGGTSWTELVRSDGGTTGVRLDGLTLNNSTSPSVGPEHNYVGYAGSWFNGIDVANSPTSRDFVLTGVRQVYSFPDGATTSGSTVVTSASGGNFVSALVGAVISGPGIPNGTTVLSVQSLTSLTMSANATATASGVKITITTNSVQDLAYWKHRGGLSPTLGIGVTPPDGSSRLQVSGSDSEPAMGTLRLRRGPSQTGKILAFHDSTPTDQLWVDKDFYLSTASTGVQIQAEPSVAGHAVSLTDNAKSQVYALDLPTGSGGVLRLRNTTNNTTIMDFGTDGSVRHLSSKIGFFQATPTTRPTITGSRGGNAALASLLTALALLGLIIDNTTA